MARTLTFLAKGVTRVTDGFSDLFCIHFLPLVLNVLGILVPTSGHIVFQVRISYHFICTFKVLK